MASRHAQRKRTSRGLRNQRGALGNWRGALGFGSRVLVPALALWICAGCGGSASSSTEQSTGEVSVPPGNAASFGSKPTEIRLLDPAGEHEIALGELSPDGLLSGTIECQNLTSHPIDLSRAVTSGGCLTVAGSVIEPSRIGALAFSLTSSNRRSLTGEVFVHIPTANSGLHILRLSWTHAPARLLIAEQSESARVDQPGLIELSIFGLDPHAAGGETVPPIPQLRMLCADDSWRLVPTTWLVERDEAMSAFPAVVRWGGVLGVSAADLRDSTNGAVEVVGEALALVHLRIEAEGWGSSRRIDLRVQRGSDSGSDIQQ